VVGDVRSGPHAGFGDFIGGFRQCCSVTSGKARRVPSAVPEASTVPTIAARGPLMSGPSCEPRWRSLVRRMTSVQQKLNGELNQGLVAADGGVEADLEVDPALEISTRAGAGAAVPVITCG